MLKRIALMVLASALLLLTGCFPGLGGTQTGQPTLKATQATFSPDGTRIAFVSLLSGQAQIYVVDASGGAARQLTTEGTNAQPAWSPDGQSILFNSNRADKNGGVFELYIMSSDGSGQRRIELDVPTP